MAILAIDQGTTSTRALLLSNSGESHIAKAIEHRQYYPSPGWVEHDPEELIRNIQSCIDVCDNVQAIGMDNQGESCLAWDADTKQAITPVIVWQDNRTQPRIRQLKANGAEKLVMEKTGLPLDAYFSASKLGWIIENSEKARHLLQQGKLRLGTTDAFFLDRLSNHFVTDISTASRTSLMDLHLGQWSEALCELFGVPINTLPTIVATTGDFGWVESRGRRIPITASVVDQQAALYGHQCKSPGDAKITFGTGAFALVNTGNTIVQSPDQGLLPTAAWQLKQNSPVYALDGAVYAAGSAINWAKSIGLFSTFEQINQFSKTSAIERDLAFVPALSGLACPHWDRQAAGLWIGLSLDTQSQDMMQSVLEGIAFRAAEVLAAMNILVPVAGAISIDGGLSVNPYFCQFLANVLAREVTVQPGLELTALGTAKLAGGRSIVGNKPRQRSITVYKPSANMQQFIDKYSQAVERSSKWKHA